MGPCITISRYHQAGEATSDTLYDVFAAVCEFTDQHALPAKIARRLAIIVEEIVTNVLAHACPGDTIALTLRLHQCEKGLFVTLEDDSIPFDPRRAPLRERPDPKRGGGVGLALVTAWADIIAYDTTARQNRLILRLHPIGDTANG